MKAVVRHFIDNPERCQRKTGKTHRQTNQTDDRLAFVFPHIAESDFDVMYKHFYLCFIKIIPFFKKKKKAYKLLNDLHAFSMFLEKMSE
jgi:hypothetical protein